MTTLTILRNCLKGYIILCAVGLLSACDKGSKQGKVAGFSIDTTVIVLAQNNSERSVQAEPPEFPNLLEDEVETYYIIIADTSKSYYTLRDKMFFLHQKSGIPIDTMGRSYNEVKDLITLPDDDDNEIYRGDYIPRRFPSNALSLEYLKFYNKTAKEKTIALVAGIYESKKSGDSACVSVKKYSNNAFNLKAYIYVGCIH